MRRRIAQLATLALVVAAGCGRVGFATLDAASADAPGLPPTDAAGGDGSARSEWVFLFDDQAEFDRGDYGAGEVPLAWDGTQVALRGGPPYDTALSGLYVSEPLDTGDDAAAWKTLSWLPESPSGRPLADARGSDSGYAQAGVDMAENILLLHLDDTALADGALIRDASGQGHDGRLVLGGQSASQTEGMFDGAVALDRQALISLDGNYFDLGTSDFTYAIWVRMYPCAESNDNRIAMGGAGTGDRPHMWIGSLCPERCPGGDGAFMNFLDDSRNGPSLSVCSGVVLTDGAWHHLAGVKRGHTSPPALVQLFVDGREVDADSYDFGANGFDYVAGEIRLGGFNLSGDQYDTRIDVDEAAIWKRALDNAEVEALYRRGRVRVDLQLRLCSGGACGSEPFVGPDGTTGTYFTEADLAGAAGSHSGNLIALGLVGRTAQVRARFSTGAPSVSPGLRSVRVAAARR